MRKIESRTSGARTRDSISTNDAIRPSASAPSSRRAGRAPAVVLRLDDHIDQQREPTGDRDGAEHVGAALLDLGAAARYEAHREEHGGEADRHIDEEDPRPGEGLREDAAEQQADGGAAGGEPGPQAQRLALVVAVGERRVDDRQRRRGDERRPDPLQRARADQHPGGAREAVDQRRDGEDRHADEEQPPAPEQVRQPAAEQQEAAEGERVGVDHPLEVRAGQFQSGLNRRQRDVDDRGIEHDHQLREADDADAEPRIVRAPEALNLAVPSRFRP